MCVCGCAVCGCVVCVVWVAHISIVKTKKLRFFRIPSLMNFLSTSFSWGIWSDHSFDHLAFTTKTPLFTGHFTGTSEVFLYTLP